MSSAPTQYLNRTSLRRQTKDPYQSQCRNPWTGSLVGGGAQDIGSGYSGNSDTLSSGSRGKYTTRTSSRQPRKRAPGSGTVNPAPEPAYENVAGRLSLGRYVSSVVPTQAATARKSHHHQGGTTTLYTLDGRGRDTVRHNHVSYLAGGANTPLIELNSPGSRGSTTSHEVGTNNIYDVIEEKSSRGRGSSQRIGTLHSPNSLGLGAQGGSFHFNRPLTPASVKTCGSETGVYACGGHCLSFERVCDKILRVVYGIGVLVGIGLLLAGMNGHQLRQHQNTLMYIGLMVFCVCCLLLWIQCRHYASRRRHRRHHPPVLRGGGGGPSGGSAGGLTPAHANMIPMAEFVNGGNYMMGASYSGAVPGPNGLPVRYTAGPHTHNGGPGHSPLIQNPLLHRYIEQQSNFTPPPPPVSELETHATSSLYVQA